MPLIACTVCGRPSRHSHCPAHLPAKQAEDKARWREGRGTAEHERIRQAVFARDGHACVICGSTKKLEAGHIVPHVAGGLFVEENLQTECQSCNRRKGAA